MAATKFLTKEQAVKDKKWFLVDAADRPVGRVASEVAKLIRGKHKTDYTPHVDSGDFVIVINAEKVRFTGRKLSDKLYYHHTQYPGGIKSITAVELLKRHPERVLEKAVTGMLPKGSLGRDMGRKLKIYAGSEHPHSAQMPQSFELKDSQARK